MAEPCSPLRACSRGAAASATVRPRDPTASSSEAPRPRGAHREVTSRDSQRTGRELTPQLPRPAVFSHGMRELPRATCNSVGRSRPPCQCCWFGTNSGASTTVGLSIAIPRIQLSWACLIGPSYSLIPRPNIVSAERWGSATARSPLAGPLKDLESVAGVDRRPHCPTSPGSGACSRIWCWSARSCG
jgi:hypothetical protein